MSGTEDEWEYETLRPPRGPTKKEAIDPKGQLNELGGDGWELVTTVEYVGGGTKYMVFKRPTNADGATNANPEDDDTERDGSDAGTEGETNADDEAHSEAAVDGEDQ